MFALGYWAMGNRQMFYNIIIPRMNSSDPLNPDHK